MSATSLFILSSTLFISPGHPAFFSQPSPQVWFSNPKAVEAQSLNSGLLVRAKDLGLSFAVGLGAPLSHSPQRIQVLSDASFNALKKCPRAALNFEIFPPRPQSIDSLKSLQNCGFQELSLNDDQQKSLEENFNLKEQELTRQGIRVRNPSWQNGRRHLSIYDNKIPFKNKLEQILGPLKAFYVFDYIDAAKPGRTLVFLLTLFEFSRSRARKLGIQWPQSVSIKNLEGGFSSSQLNANGQNSLELGADFGESIGVGKILAQPQIRTKPGEKALFQSGGEIPVRSHSLTNSNTTWKSYGLMVNLEPDAAVETGASEISLGFRVELSEPDAATALDGVPGMIVRRLESHFDLRTNETTVLTTMIQTRRGTNRSGIAGAMNIPVLGNLFSDRADLEQGSELWFSIRPTWEEITPREATKNKFSDRAQPWL